MILPRVASAFNFLPELPGDGSGVSDDAENGLAGSAMAASNSCTSSAMSVSLDFEVGVLRIISGGTLILPRSWKQIIISNK